MKITDQQFINAMNQAVKEKGPEHRAPGTYFSYTEGAYCIVGYALWTIKHELCPISNYAMADTLLPQMGVSERVAMAAYAAQHVNDMNRPWGVVLEAFNDGLQNWTPGVSTGEFLREVIEKHRYAQIMEFMKKPKAPVVPSMTVTGDMVTGTLATGGKVTVTFNGTGLVCADPACTCQSMGANLKELAESANKAAQAMQSFAKVTMPKKKDHALVA